MRKDCGRSVETEAAVNGPSGRQASAPLLNSEVECGWAQSHPDQSVEIFSKSDLAAAAEYPRAKALDTGSSPGGH